MPTPQEIKQEIINAITFQNQNDRSAVEAELLEMENTNGLEGKNNLETFYDVWKKNKGNNPGTTNKINSWTAYFLNLTTAKPSNDFLPKRRAFARAGFPDIDSDFDYFRRQEIYDFLIQKYGERFVTNSGTYNTIKLKDAVRRIGKAIDVAGAFHKGTKEYKTENEAKVREISDSLPHTWGANIKVKDENGKEHTILTVEDAYKYCEDFKQYIDLYPEIRTYAKDIEGLYSSAGRHPAGMVLSSIPLEEIAPRRMTKKGLATQFTYDDLESMGLIKFDILAISTLTTVSEALKLIKANYGINVDIKHLPLTDEKTYELYRSGKLTGVFQCEKPGMKDTIQTINVDKFEDIMAAIALYRPGPMGSIPEYCEKKNGRQDITYPHSSIEKYVKPYLARTYGNIVYQENILQICGALANFSVTDAYIMIKGVSKKKDYIIQKYKKQFIEGSHNNGVPEKVAEDYWDRFITPFASYGFNAAHCVSGEMIVRDEITRDYITVESLEKRFSDVKRQFTSLDRARELKMMPNIQLNSYKNGYVVKDQLMDVYKTGEKEVFKVRFDNGLSYKCSIDHRFYCSDGKEHTVREIIDGELEILYVENKIIKKTKYKLSKSLGMEMTYNMTMAGEQHNYALYNIRDRDRYVFSKNSCCYAYLSYMTAYLKANYTDEFFTAYLNVENIRKKHDKVKTLEGDLKNFGIRLLPRKINDCGVDYKIVKKKDVSAGIMYSEIMPSVMCKGMGVDSAEEIVRAGPYDNLKDIAYKTDTSVVDKDVIRCLVEGGFYDDTFADYNKGREKGQKVNREKFAEIVVGKFEAYRVDVKKAGLKGLGSESLFD